MKKVTKITLDKKQKAFIEKDGSNGIGIVSGTIQEIGNLLTRYPSQGCQIVFNTAHAPNFKRCFNSYVKRANRISDAAGVSLSAPVEYFIDGYRQADRFVLEVL